MSDEHMMLMSQGAIEALEDQSFDSGYEKGKADASYEARLVLAQFKKMEEILEATDQPSLLDGCHRLIEETRAHREAMKVAAAQLEKQRKRIDELVGETTMLHQSLTTMSLTLDQQHNEIRDLKGEIAAWEETA